MKNDVLKAIAARYSCRAYTDQPISVEAANALIDAALHAPSARNGQPWHFSVVQNTEDLRAFDDAMRDILRTREPEKYADDSYSVTYRAPMVIFITAPDAPSNVFTKIDCGIAVQNIALAAQSMGLGSVILGMPREVFTSQRAAEFKKKFAVPDGYEFQIAIAVGHANATKEPHIPEEDKYSLIL